MGWGVVVACVWCVVSSLVLLSCRSHVLHVHLHIHIHIVGVTLFAHLLHGKSLKRTLTFHDVCFSKPLTSQNSFRFFASRSCFKHLSRLQALLDLYKRCSLKTRKVLETATRSKKLKPLWKVKGFEKQTSWKASVLDCFFIRK